MMTTSLRHLVRLYTPIQQVTRNPPLPLFRHAGHILHSRPATVRARVPPGRNSFEKVRFTIADVPPLSFWAEYIKHPMIQPDEVSAAECLEACRRYAALAIENSPGWRQRALTTTAPTITTSNGNSGGASSQDDGKVSLRTLNYVFAFLIQSGTAGHLATHIMHSGVMLGHAPSVLTAARLALERDLLDRPHFAPAKEALERLAASASSSSPSSSSRSSTKRLDRGNSSGDGDGDYYLADALTAMGLIHARQNTPAGDERALRFFDRASHAAAAAAAWQWRASAVLAQTKIHLRRGRRDRARELLRETAPMLDNAEAYYQYAQLLEGEIDDPERVALLERAAVGGAEGAAREMSRVELLRLEEEDGEKKAGGKGGLSEREKRDRRFLADEWLVIAGDKASI
ncbi:hypothetical protein F4820DRAFT_408361 [Hypoxylon rubiginosum]|uniref:Uncharacterized protein n=1 Tax=Hypoxylon rubiginosum TaxID=110542 RepID=A0ACB9ZBL3_9PEZI|nr:hypothetical protein F4820DRAFT_408361 [Hypoxylon rubiginosum]